MKSYAQTLINILSACLTVYPIYFFDGNQLGLMDANGKTIVPAKYSEIRYLEKGLYLMRSVGLALEPGKKFSLVDHDGGDVKAHVPEGSEFAGVYYLPPDAASVTICKTHSLPKSTVLIFRQNDKFGLCSLTGEILLPANYGAIDNINGGLPLIFQNAVKSTYPDRELYVAPDKLEQHECAVYTFDVSAKKLITLSLPPIYTIAPEYSDGLRAFCSLSKDWMRECKGLDGKVSAYQVLHGFLNKQGSLAIKPTFNKTSNFENGRAVVKVYPGPNVSGGDFFVVDREGKRISPPEMQVVTSFQKEYLTRAGGINTDGLVDNNFNPLMPSEYSSIRLRKDGTFQATKSRDKATFVISNSGNILEEVSFQHIDGRSIYLKCVPKTNWPNDATAIAHSYEDVRLKDGAFAVAAGNWKPSEKGLVLAYAQIIFNSGDDEIPECFQDSLVAKVYPKVPILTCQPDRIIMREARGLSGFDSDAWKERSVRLKNFQRHVAFDPKNPPKISNVNIDLLDMFCRCLHEFDLIGMSQERVAGLFGESQELILAGGGCVPHTGARVRFTYDGNKVKSWNLWGREITENVVLVPANISEK